MDGTLDQSLAIGSFAGSNWLNPTRNTNFLWSPDGKYLARMTRQADGSSPGLYVNRALVYPSPMSVSRPFFSADSQHIYWQAAERFPDRGPPYYITYVDGVALTKLSGDPFQSNMHAWVVDPAGVLTFVGVDGGFVKRYRVTPDSGLTVDKMVTNAAAAQAKAASDAAAAQAKVAQDNIEAEAKAKTDVATALEKRKADQAAAYAAKQQAAIEARNAKKLKQLNAQRAKKGLPALSELPEGP